MIRMIAVTLLCAAVLTACSRTEFLYDNADWFVYRWVDGLLDADDTQRERWQVLFGDVLEQHRQTLLPDVVALLHGFAVQAEQGLSQRALQCLWRDTDRLLEAHAELAVAPGARVLDGLSMAQVEHMQAAFDDRIDEYRDKYLQADPEVRVDERVQRFVDRIEYWTGDLDDAQRQRVDEAVRRMPDIAGTWLDYRTQQQQQLLSVLRDAPTRDRIEQQLRAWWVEQSGRDSTLTRDIEQVRLATIRLLVALDAQLHPRQRRHLLREISSLRDDLAAAGDVERMPQLALHTAAPCTQLL